MDQDALVTNSISLIQSLEAKQVIVRGAMLVTLPDIGGWRLWIVGAKKVDKKEFYRHVAGTLSEMSGHLSISDIELKKDDDPVIVALSKLIHAESLVTAHLSRNMINGVYTPDGILLRMAL